MNSRILTGILVLAMTVLAVLYAWQPWTDEPAIKLGLDLQGGLRVTLVSDTANPADEDLNTARNIVQNRVNQFGVSEALVQTAGNDKIVVELPGLTADDQQRALDLIGQQAVLEFRLVRPAANAVASEFLTLDDLEPIAFTGEIISNASAQFQQSPGQPSGPVVVFEIRASDQAAFGNFTGGNVGRRMAIVLDNVIVTAPTLQSRISDSGQITGVGSLEEASDVAVVLRSGSLPISLHVDEVRSIGPTLGQDSINSGTTAAVIGGAAVIVAVLIYYGPLFGGVLALGVILAMLFIFGVLGALGAALTLPGLAGLVLTIGAAVDGNVISFERVREELREGKTLRAAMKRGFSLSVSAIVDANLTSLLVAGALYQYTTGAVRGFAVTLAIGILASMFVNLVVVPWLLTLLTERSQRSYMWIGRAISGLEFVRRAAPIVAVSTFLAVASLVYVSVAGLKLSTDFTGGSNILLDMPAGTTSGDLRNAINALEVPGVDGNAATIVEIEGGTNLMSVRVSLPDDDTRATEQFALELASSTNAELQSAEFVGPSVGADLRRGAILSVLVSLGLILVYVGVRFWPNWIIAVGTVIATAHDVAITLGIMALVGMEFTIPVLAALLFVVGYSLNDSIIISDRVRENAGILRGKSYRQIVDISVNQVLTRTIVTGGTTLLPVLALLFFGGSVLRGFSITLMIGIVIGTFSSIFLLSPLMVWGREWVRKYDERRRSSRRPGARA